MSGLNVEKKKSLGLERNEGETREVNNAKGYITNDRISR
jgi:hypothetical protein